MANITNNALFCRALQHQKQQNTRRISHGYYYYVTDNSKVYRLIQNFYDDYAKQFNSSSYPRQPRLSGGCSACIEQSATKDSGLLLTFDIPEVDQVSPFSSVIRLG